MIPGDGYRQAIFGGPLWGDRAVRFVFIDEAGTSEHEPVTVVIGLIVNADQQLIFAEQAINETLGSVPHQFRDNFVFHAKELWGSPRYKEKWPMAGRLALLHAMMSLPRRLNFAISMSCMRRDTDDPGFTKDGLTRAQWHHYISFAKCIASADRYIRTYADPSEVATVVAEDVPEMRHLLADAALWFRRTPFFFEPGMFTPTEAEQQQGFSEQATEYRVSRIRRAVHFAKKGEDSILQLADACAFAFRRFLADQQFGDEFVKSVLGASPHKPDYQGPSSTMNYYFHPKNAAF